MGANIVRLERLMQETAELPLHKDTETERESERKREKKLGAVVRRGRVMCKKDSHSLTRKFLALRPHNSQDRLSLSWGYTYPTSCMAGYDNPTPFAYVALGDVQFWAYL